MNTVVRRCARARRRALHLPIAVAVVAGLALSVQPAGAAPVAPAATTSAAPTAVTATGIADPAPCTASSATPLSTAATVTVRGAATASGQVVFTFAVYRTGDRTPLRVSPSITAAAGSPRASWSVEDLPDGSYWYRVRASQGGDTAPVTAAADARFVVDTTAPAVAPSVDSFDYPADSWGAAPGTGSILLGAGGDAGVVGYAYSWTSASAIPTPAAGCAATPGSTVLRTGDVTALAVPRDLGPGARTLFVRPFDAARRIGPTGTYEFRMSPAPDFGSRREAEALPRTVTLLPQGGNPTGAGSTAYNKYDAAASGRLITVLLATAGDPVDGPEYRFAFSAPITADYAFGTRFIRADHFGILQFGIRSGGTTTWLIDPNTQEPYRVDGYAPTAAPAFATLGARTLSRGSYEFVVKVVGKNPDSVSYDDRGTGSVVADNGFSGALDTILIAPVANRSVTSVADARNNDGVAPNGTAGNIGPSAGRSALSENALRNMGEYSRTSPVFTTGGVRFTMPTSYSGNDNVVAIGQRIPLDGGPRAVKRLELLVTAACGPVGGDPSQVLSLNYSQGIPGSARWPVTPDFTAAKPTPAQLASWRTPTGTAGVDNTIAVAGGMPYRTQNGRIVNSPALLYRVTVPVDPTRQLASITLPYTGTRLTTACDPALHVFAVTSVS